MNRAERRQLEKQKIKGEIKETISLNDYIDLYSIAFMMAMDSCDIEVPKIHEIMAKVFETCDCILSDNLSKKDLLTMARETFNVDFLDDVKDKIYVVNGKLVRTY